MSPVHVIVGDDPRAEQMWATAFTGAVDLYRFERNAEAFERLTAAQAPIDLVVLTPAQRGPFNLTPDQFVARVLEGPLGSTGLLANLHVIVVGGALTRSHPRAMSVSTLDAAIRLVKFGEVERAPRPDAPKLPDARAISPVRRSADGVREPIADLPFSGSVISRIWDAPDPTATPASDARPIGEGADDDMDFNVLGGGAPASAPVPAPEPAPVPSFHPAPAAGPAQLFSRITPPGFAAATPAAPSAPATVAAPVMGGGAPDPSASAPVMGYHVGAPGEAIEVATGTTLQPARGYQLEGGGAYRGPALRGGVIHTASHDAGGQPVPPALTSQVQTMVYGGMQVGNPHDPLLVWSSSARSEAAPAQRPTAAPMPIAAPMPMPMPMPQQVRTVPMEPPAGVYAPAPAMSQAHAQPAQSADPFLRRAEAGGGDVSFG